jgi:molecular chaperone DnaK
MATGKEQSMTVTGGSALGKDEIDRMVKEAEANAEADKKRREAVEMRNEADALAFRTEKLLDENFDKIPEDTKAPVTEAIATLKETLKGTDNDDEVKAAMDDLNQKASAMGQAIYAAVQQAQAENPQGQDAESASSESGDDTVVDAEIVDDEDEKK